MLPLAGLFNLMGVIMRRALIGAGFFVTTLVSLPALAQFTSIATPTADYTSSTTVVTIPGANGSTTTTLTSGTETLTFGSSVSVRTVGINWSTWNSPPAVESSTPKIVTIDTALTSLTITLSEPHTTFGFELEPSVFSSHSVTATFMNGATSLGTVTRTVSGNAGALLFAGTSSTPITSVVLTVPSAANGFAMAQFRFSTPAPVPAMGSVAFATFALLLLVGGTLLIRRRGLAS